MVEYPAERVLKLHTRMQTWSVHNCQAKNQLPLRVSHSSRVAFAIIFRSSPFHPPPAIRTPSPGPTAPSPLWSPGFETQIPPHSPLPRTIHGSSQPWPPATMAPPKPPVEHKIDRTPEYEKFIEDLRAFHAKRGTQFDPEPKMGNMNVDQIGRAHV